MPLGPGPVEEQVATCGFLFRHVSMKVQLKENSWLAKLAAVKMRSSRVAIVFGSTIHLHNTSKKEFLADPKWVCHELKHVEQYRRLGIPGFVSRYLLEWLKKGYYNNRFEAEARKSEGDKRLLQKAQFR